jgi:dihydrolipoamide dehydrogenase
MKKSTDLTIIGGGPGAYVAGPLAKSKGLEVVCVEKEILGGVCLKWGCMPTKSLASVSKCMDMVKKSSDYGINVSEYSLDFLKVMRRCKRHVKMLEEGCVSKFKNMGIEMIMGTGTVKDKNTVKVMTNEGQSLEIETRYIILDTGSLSVEIPPMKLSEQGILDHKGVLSLNELPESMIIVGGGTMGCEFANIFSNFGVKITIVELLPVILNSIDADVRKVLENDFQKRGIDIITGEKLVSFKKNNSGFICELSSGRKINTQKILLTAGRKPNSEGIGLEENSVKKTEYGIIVVDKYLQTSVPSIYAIGDVIGGNLAHVARKEGEVVIDNILGNKKAMDYRVVPWVIYTNVEIAGVGITEMEAREKNIPYKVASSSFRSNGKALVSDETEGFAKILIDEKTRTILGSRIIGSNASDLINEICLAMKCKIQIDDISDMIHAHPTLGEAVLKVARSL